MSTVALGIVLALMLVLGTVGLVTTMGDIRNLESTLCARIDQDIKNAKFTHDRAEQPPSIRSFHGSLIPELRRELDAVSCP